MKLLFDAHKLTGGTEERNWTVVTSERRVHSGRSKLNVRGRTTGGTGPPPLVDPCRHKLGGWDDVSIIVKLDKNSSTYLQPPVLLLLPEEILIELNAAENERAGQVSSEVLLVRNAILKTIYGRRPL